MGKAKKILVLAPHVDDGEFGCGGSIHRYIREGQYVRYIAFSDCKESIPKDLHPETLSKEMKEATQILGVGDSHLYDFPVRRFNQYRQEILDTLIVEKNNYNPDIVFTPCTHDIHQDHGTLTTEAIRAFKGITIYGYELPWNLLTLPSTCFIELEEEDVDKKVEAIMAYKSQCQRTYSNASYIKALATTRGMRIQKQYAEVFEAIRIVL